MEYQRLETSVPQYPDPDPAPPKVPLPIPWISTEAIPDAPLVHPPKNPVSLRMSAPLLRPNSPDTAGHPAPVRRFRVVLVDHNHYRAPLLRALRGHKKEV